MLQPMQRNTGWCQVRFVTRQNDAPIPTTKRQAKSAVAPKPCLPAANYTWGHWFFDTQKVNAPHQPTAGQFTYDPQWALARLANHGLTFRVMPPSRGLSTQPITRWTSDVVLPRHPLSTAPTRRARFGLIPTHQLRGTHTTPRQTSADAQEYDAGPLPNTGWCQFVDDIQFNFAPIPTTKRQARVKMKPSEALPAANYTWGQWCDDTQKGFAPHQPTAGQFTYDPQWALARLANHGLTFRVMPPSRGLSTQPITRWTRNVVLPSTAVSTAPTRRAISAVIPKCQLRGTHTTPSRRTVATLCPRAWLNPTPRHCLFDTQCLNARHDTGV